MKQPSIRSYCSRPRKHHPHHGRVSHEEEEILSWWSSSSWPMRLLASPPGLGAQVVVLAILVFFTTWCQLAMHKNLMSALYMEDGEGPAMATAHDESLLIDHQQHVLGRSIQQIGNDQRNAVSAIAPLDVSSSTRSLHHASYHDHLNTSGASASLFPGLCGGCLLQSIHHRDGRYDNITCGSLIFHQLKKQVGHHDNNMSFQESAALVAQKFPDQCARCRPYACPPHQQHFWRLDQAAPLVLAAYSHRFKTIPEKFRLARDGVLYPYRYFRRNPHKTFNRQAYLFEYNPTLTKLPSSQIPLRYQAERPVYLASYRISRYTYCIKNLQISDIKKPFPDAVQDSLGLALLRADFSVIQEGVFNVSARIRFEDARLFTLQDRLFMATFDQVVEMWLVPPAKRSSPTTLVHLNNMFGTSDFRITMRSFPTCCASPSCYGKNFNLFVDAQNQIMIETNPVGPHIVETINLDRPCDQSRQVNDSIVYLEKKVPPPSYYTLEEVLFPRSGSFVLPHSSEHGTACCVSVADPRLKSADGVRNITSSPNLLVGISHSKTDKRKRDPVLPNRFHYYSRLYAFEPTPPYRIVAVSGEFCLGFAEESEYARNRHHRMARGLRIVLNGTSFNCPIVGFASGITEKADNSSRVVISYGINDCSGRMVEVEKSELVQMLFGARQPPAEIATQR